VKELVLGPRVFYPGVLHLIGFRLCVMSKRVGRAISLSYDNRAWAQIWAESPRRSFLRMEAILTRVFLLPQHLNCPRTVTRLLIVRLGYELPTM